MDKKTSFILYPADFLAAVHNFRKSQIANFIIALCEFNLYGSVTLKLSELEKKRFDSLQKDIDIRNENWRKTCEINAQNAKIGASKRKATAKRKANVVADNSPNVRKGDRERESESDNENGCIDKKANIGDKPKFAGAPSVEEVADYAKKNGYTIDPVAFVRWNEERCWMNGKKYIALDWQKAVKKWYCKENNLTYAELECAEKFEENKLGKGLEVQDD